MKYFYCNLCGKRDTYVQGKMPRLCESCKSEKDKLYYTYQKRPAESFPSGKKIRDLCLERDNYQCVLCGSTTKLSVHHRDGNSYRKIGQLANNKLENLITLCHKCHMERHFRQGDIPIMMKEERTKNMINYHFEHPEIRHAKLARMFGLSRERVGQVLGRVKKKNFGYPLTMLKKCDIV